jgi:steroid delta-isomerase-like uncharacterized protein
MAESNFPVNDKAMSTTTALSTPSRPTVPGRAAELELFSDDAVYTAPAGRHEGRERIRSWFSGWADAFSDVSFVSSLVVEQDDAVVAEWTWRAVHTGSLVMPGGATIPASGNALEFPGVTILRVGDGRIVAARDYEDQLDSMIQLGLTPGSCVRRENGDSMVAHLDTVHSPPASRSKTVTFRAR